MKVKPALQDAGSRWTEARGSMKSIFAMTTASLFGKGGERCAEAGSYPRRAWTSGRRRFAPLSSEVTEEGPLNIIGVGSSPSRGLRKGVVVDIESTVESIKKAVEEAELMAAVQINSVYTGIAGSHISAENCKGVVALKKHGSHAGRHPSGDRKCADAGGHSP